MLQPDQVESTQDSILPASQPDHLPKKYTRREFMVLSTLFSGLSAFFIFNPHLFSLLRRKVRLLGRTTRTEQTVLPTLEAASMDVTSYGRQVPGSVVQLGMQLPREVTEVLQTLPPQRSQEAFAAADTSFSQIELHEQLKIFLGESYAATLLDGDFFSEGVVTSEGVRAAQEQEQRDFKTAEVRQDEHDSNCYHISYLDAQEQPQNFQVQATYYKATQYSLLNSLYGSDQGNETVVQLEFLAEQQSQDHFQYHWNLYFLADAPADNSAWASTVKAAEYQGEGGVERKKLAVSTLLEHISYNNHPAKIREALRDATFDIANTRSDTPFQAVNHFVSGRISPDAHSHPNSPGQPVAGDGSTNFTYVQDSNYWRQVLIHELAHAASLFPGLRSTDEQKAETALATAALHDGEPEVGQRYFQFESGNGGPWDGSIARPYQPGEFALLLAELTASFNLPEAVVASVRGETTDKALPDLEKILEIMQMYRSAEVDFARTIDRTYQDSELKQKNLWVKVLSLHNLAQFLIPCKWSEHLKALGFTTGEGVPLVELNIEEFINTIASDGYANMQDVIHQVYAPLWLESTNLSPYQKVVKAKLLEFVRQEVEYVRGQKRTRDTINPETLDQAYKLVILEKNEQEKYSNKTFTYTVADYYDEELIHGWKVPVLPLYSLASLPDLCFQSASNQTAWIENTSGSPIYIISPFMRTKAEVAVYGGDLTGSPYIQKIEPGQKQEVRFDLVGGGGLLGNWGGECMLLCHIWNDPALRPVFARMHTSDEAVMKQERSLFTVSIEPKVAVPIISTTIFPIEFNNGTPA